MAVTIVGIFDDPYAARRALENLRDGPLMLDDISIISRATESGAAVSNDTDVSAGEGAAIGAVWGGLVGLAALLIPGIGPFVAGGALFAALTGAATGAVVGGIAAALIDFGGVPEDEARRYESMVQQGRTLVAVKARSEDAHEVRRQLAAAGAASIHDSQTDMTSATGSPVHVAVYEDGRRIDTDSGMERRVGATHTPGIYDTPITDRAADSTRPATSYDTGVGLDQGRVTMGRDTQITDTTNHPKRTPDRTS